MMLPVLAGYIAMSIADRPGLAVGFRRRHGGKDGSHFHESGRRRCELRLSAPYWLVLSAVISLSC